MKARMSSSNPATDKIDAELIARFLALRPEAGRTLPDEKL